MIIYKNSHITPKGKFFNCYFVFHGSITIEAPRSFRKKRKSFSKTTWSFPATQRYFRTLPSTLQGNAISLYIKQVRCTKLPSSTFQPPPATPFSILHLHLAPETVPSQQAAQHFREKQVSFQASTLKGDLKGAVTDFRR